MTDRAIVYDGALPQTVDILNAGKGALLGDSLGWAAILGNVTSVAGLACLPTAPASLQVTVGQGSIYSVNNIDATAYGDLGTDSVTVLKQGILKSPVTLTLTAPGTSGFSQNYLVQAIQQDVDGGSTVISYFNAVPPNTPFAGPGNDGLSQFTLRQGLCTISLVAGTAATTGTQTTPPPSAGNTGLYVITVANGQTTITSGNITQLSTAPFIPVTLPLVPQGVQNGTWVYAVDTGTTSALAITPFPPVASYVAGQSFEIKVANTISGASTLNVSGLGTKAIVNNFDGSPVVSNQILAGSIISVIYDGTVFRLVPVSNGGQQILTSNTTFTVATTGSDSNPGTVALPFLTIQKAVNVAATFASATNFKVTINVLSGTFAGFSTPSWAFAPTTVNGNGATNTFITGTTSSVCQFNGPNTFILQNVNAATTLNAPNAAAISATAGAVLTVNNVTFGGTASTTGIFLNALQNSTIFPQATTISASAGTIAAAANTGALINITAATVWTISTAITVNVAFVAASNLGLISSPTGAQSTVNPGNVTGPRYLASINAAINTNGSGATYFAGTVAGSVNNGGLYV